MSSSSPSAGENETQSSFSFRHDSGYFSSSSPLTVEPAKQRLLSTRAYENYVTQRKHLDILTELDERSIFHVHRSNSFRSLHGGSAFVFESVAHMALDCERFSTSTSDERRETKSFPFAPSKETGAVEQHADEKSNQSAGRRPVDQGERLDGDKSPSGGQFDDLPVQLSKISSRTDRSETLSDLRLRLHCRCERSTRVKKNVVGTFLLHNVRSSLQNLYEFALWK